MHRSFLFAASPALAIIAAAACGTSIAEMPDGGAAGSGGVGGSYTEPGPGGAAPWTTTTISGSSTGWTSTTGTWSTGTWSTGTWSTGTSSTGTWSTTTTGSTSVTVPDGGTQECPGAEPADGSACSSQGATCAYGVDQCSCGQGTWHCHACPNTEPAAGSACNVFGTCTYGGDSCHCAQGIWECATCPATTPPDGSQCTTQGINCTYADAACHCGGGGPGGPGGTTWHCNAACPVAEPAPGSTCSSSPQQPCTYGSKTCVCLQGVFYCN